MDEIIRRRPSSSPDASNFELGFDQLEAAHPTSSLQIVSFDASTTPPAGSNATPMSAGAESTSSGSAGRA